MNKGKFLLVLVVLTFGALACGTLNFNQLAEGQLRVETSLPLNLIQTALETAANFDQLIGLTLESRNGYIYVHADEIELEGVTGQDVSFHLELTAENGDLNAEITTVQASNESFDDSYFESFNEELAQILTDENGLEDITNFESVSITPDGISVVVIVDTNLSN
jgi:hypothetical protein